METKKSLKKIPLILLIVGIVLSCFLFDSATVSIINVIAVLLLGIIAIKELNRTGNWSLVTTLGPVFLKAIKEYFTEIAPIQAITDYLNQSLLKLGINKPISNDITFTILFYLLLILILLFVGSVDNTAIGIQNDDADEFKERTYSEKSDMFCKFLKQRLERIDTDTNWNEQLYTPIAAEIEMSKKRRKHRYSDMLKCLKKNQHHPFVPLKRFVNRLSKSKIFGRCKSIQKWKDSLNSGNIYLVLGDPGSGKSVSLRKLCYELLLEANISKRIPVYIDLKKWKTVNSQSTQNDLIDFIKLTLNENIDVVNSNFLQDYFDKMLENGRWYFIFDSFDELPCLMGHNNSNQIIDNISYLLYEFLSSYNQAGGIIASRFYHAPTNALHPTVTLNLMEFDNTKIRVMLKKYIPSSSDELCRKLFRDGGLLVSLCRNPFYLMLIINYLINNNMALPTSQYELYSDFINSRFSICQNKYNISETVLLDAAKKLAQYMQTSESGLEITHSELCQQNDTIVWNSVLMALGFAKLCRVNEVGDTVSFAHRRFQEFFYVKCMIDGDVDVSSLDYNCIPNNTGVRDALVLYCEIADENKAKEIAQYCWNTIVENIQWKNSITNQGCKRLVYTLYFLIEAYQKRLSAIQSFIKDLEEIIVSSINKKTDLIVLLAMVKSVVLFEKESQKELLYSVFKLNNGWLIDIIVRNYFLISDSDDYNCQLMLYFSTQNPIQLIKNYSNISFSLSVHKRLSSIVAYHKAKVLDYIFISLEFLCFTINLLFGHNISLILYFLPLSRIISFPIYNIVQTIIVVLMMLLLLSEGLLEWCVFNQDNLPTMFRIRKKVPQKEGNNQRDSDYRFHNNQNSIWIINAGSLTLIFLESYSLPLLCFVFLIPKMLTIAMNCIVVYKKIRALKISFKDVLNTIKKALLLLLLLCLIGVGLFVGILGGYYIIQLIIEKSIIDIIGITLVIVFIGFSVVYLTTEAMITFFHDKRLIKNNHLCNTIERSALEKFLLDLKKTRNRRKYVKYLFDNHVNLKGAWQNGARPVFNDNQLNYYLASIDIDNTERINLLHHQ